MKETISQLPKSKNTLSSCFQQMIRLLFASITQFLKAPLSQNPHSVRAVCEAVRKVQLKPKGCKEKGKERKEKDKMKEGRKEKNDNE